MATLASATFRETSVKQLVPDPPITSPIHLRPVGGRVVVLYLELLAELSDHLVVKIGTIIRNDPLRYTVSTDQVVPNEPCHDVLGYGSVGSCLDPFCEVINRY